MGKFQELYERIMNEARPAISPSLLKQMMAKEKDASFFAVKADGKEYHNPLGKIKTKASINKLYNYLKRGMEIDILYIFNKNGEVVNIIKKTGEPRGVKQADLIKPTGDDLKKAPKFIKEGKEEAPNYRKANQKDGKKEPMCSACVHNVDGECEKFDFIFDRGYTCDAWGVKN